MKKVIVTTLILIVLGTVWTLFLEHEKRRFEESLPKVPIMVTQPVDAVDTSAVSEESDSATEVPGQWIPIGDNASTAGKQTEVEAVPHEDTEEFTVEEMIELFEAELAETAGPQHNEVNNSFEEFLESQGITREEYEKQEIARETLHRILANPANVLVGQPLEVGAVYVMPASQHEALLQAAIVLDPSAENKRALERLRRRERNRTVPEPDLETYKGIQIEGIQID